MNYSILESHLLKNMNISLDYLYKLYDNEKNLENEKREIIQIYLEMKSIIPILKCEIPLIDEISSHLLKILSKKPFNIINFIVKHRIFYYNLKNVQYELIIPNLVTILILKSMTNNLTYSEKDLNDKIYYNKYNIINEVSDDILKFIIFFYDENLNINLNELHEKKTLEQIIKLMVFKSLSLLHNLDYIEKKNDKSNTKTKNRKNIFGKETQSFFSLKKPLTLNKLNVSLNTFFNHLETKEFGDNLYYKSYHFLSITNIFRENWRSKEKFNLTDKTNVLEKLKKMKYYLNKELYLNLKNQLIKNLKIDVKNDINNDELLDIIIEKYNKNRKLYFFKINQKNNSELYHIIIYLYIERYNFLFENYFYLPHYFDFRGRLYSDSVISPVGNKIFRFLYTYGDYSTNELENFKLKNKINPTIINYIIEKTNIDKIFSNINENPIFHYIIYTCFIELGKIDKNRYLEENDGKLTAMDFIKIGINVFNEYNNTNIKNKTMIENEYISSDESYSESESSDYEYEDLEYKSKVKTFTSNLEFGFKKNLEILYIMTILNMWNNGKYKKFIIWKDATASAIQILMILFKSLDETNLERCNLTNSIFWWDTYFHIIKYFMHNYKKKDETLKFNDIFFNRVHLKKTIMTYMYSASERTCYINFLKSIYSEDKVFRERNFLKKEFEEFYKFLKFFFDEGIFFDKKKIEKFNDTKINNIKNNLLNQTTYDDSQFSLLYYKLKNWRPDKKLNKIRYTVQFKVLTNIKDDKKIRSSYNPNVIHSIDATIIRLVLSNFLESICTIHDSFGIHILNIEELILAIIQAYNDLNRFYNPNSNTTIISIFILL